MKKLNSCVLASVMVASSLGVVNAAPNNVIAGEDRFATAAKIADQIGSYDTAILVNGYSISDGLAASSLAKYKNAPILLVKNDKIPESTAKRLRKVKNVYLIGLEGAISKGVESQLKSRGKRVTRLGGNNRVSTSIKVANEIGNYNEAFIVNGFTGEADAMSVASIAARDKAPIIVTNGKTAPTFRDNNVNYYAIGGTAVVKDPLVNYYGAQRIAGSNRYKTNEMVLNKFYPNTSRLYAVDGLTLVDALAVSTIASNNGVALTSKNSNKYILNGKEIIEVGGNVHIDAIAPKPDVKPDENKPVRPDPDMDLDHPMPGGFDIYVSDYNKNVVVKQGDNLKVSDFGIVAYDRYWKAILPENMKITSPVNTNIPGKHTVSIELRSGSIVKVVNFDFTVKANEVKPTPKPDEKPTPTPNPGVTANLNDERYQKIARNEFFRLLDAYRAANGKTQVEHHEKMNKSAWLKSKDMVDNDYFDHRHVDHPDYIGGAECCAQVGQIDGDFTEADAKYIGQEAFKMWKTSTKGHNEILLSDDGYDEWNNTHIVDGFGYYAKYHDFGDFGVWSIKATYHRNDTSLDIFR